MIKNIFTLFVFNFSALAAFCQSAGTFELSSKWQPLIDQELSNWELFVGVPHISVDLEGYAKSENVHVGTPIGLNDPKNVMSVITEDTDLVLKITGEIYAGLTTLHEFGNYHLRAEFKWGEKKWEPRLDKKRDNGILYHCHGDHGAFWNVWMSGLECQVQEGDTGDFVGLVFGAADIHSSQVSEKRHQVTGENDQLRMYGGEGNPNYCHIQQHNEKPNGEWNVIEVICVGDRSIHVVNGQVVMVALNTRKAENGTEETLTKGKIQIQSEGAEAYYKNIEIKSVTKFPSKYKKQTELL